MAEASVRKQLAQGEEVKTFRRRGWFAAVVAAVAAIVVKQSEQPVEADGTQGTPMDLGVSNTETAGTIVKWAGTAGFSGVMLLGNDTNFSNSGSFYPAAAGGWAGSGGGTFAGVKNGVYGYAEVASGNGVVGLNVGTGVGVLGQNRGGGTGVLGEVPAGNTNNAIAVYGLNNSSYAGPGPGAGGFGVYGLSAKGHGLVGATATAGGSAVVGATNGVSGAYAGAFYGPVIVSGALTVFGAKSAAVPHPDGSHRLLYCVESPESWFEDFGKAQLSCGEAVVAFDPDFAAVVRTDDYHVFLTEYDDHNLAYVTERTPSGFRVRTKTGNGEGILSWRVVAKRRDIAGERLARVTIPAEPVLPSRPPFEDASLSNTGIGATGQRQQRVG